MFSPYAAMGNAPESMVDPNGEIFNPTNNAFTYAGSSNENTDKGNDGDYNGLMSRLFGNGESGLVGRIMSGGGFNVGASGNANSYSGKQAGIVFLLLTGQINLIAWFTGTANNNQNSGVKAVDHDFNPKTGHKGDPLTADKSGLFSYRLVKYSARPQTTGISFELISTVKQGTYDAYDFIQTVASSIPDLRKGDSKTEFYLDGKDGADKPPFYFTSSDRFTAKLISYNNDYQSYFQDGPQRDINTRSYWLGQLTLMGQKNGAWESIFTIRYGFRYEGPNGIMHLIEPVLMEPESNQQRFIKMSKYVK